MKKAERDKPVVMITGASRGIGEETARQLASRGYALVLAARSEERLRHLAQEFEGRGAPCLVVPTDIRAPEQVQRLATCALERFGHVDILINNAGVAYAGMTVAGLSDFHVHSILATNLLAPIQLTRALLPSMLARKRGLIVFIDSLAGHVALPSLALYSSTKFGLRGFATALRREVKTQGVHVCLISPGLIKTGLSESWGELLMGIPLMIGRPQAVAKAVLRVIRRPRRDVILPAYNRPIVWIDRYLPRLADAIANLYMRRFLPGYEARQTAAAESPSDRRES